MMKPTYHNGNVIAETSYRYTGQLDMVIRIKEPIWNGGRRMVGLAHYRVLQEGAITKVIIETKVRDGTWLAPNIYCMSSARVIQYPVQYKGETALYVVPVDDMCIEGVRPEVKAEIKARDRANEGKQLAMGI